MTELPQDTRKRFFCIGPKELPTTPTDETVLDLWVQELRIVNTGDQAAIVSVYDRQTPAIAMIPAMTLGKGATISDTYGRIGRIMYGGLIWSASNPGVHGYVIGYALG